MYIPSAVLALLLSASPAAGDTTAARAYLGAPADSLAVRSDVWSGAAVVAPRRMPSPAEVQRLHAKLSSNDLLRIEGAFGRVEGRAARITATGFEEFQTDLEFAPKNPPRTLAWEQIDRVHAKHNGAGRGATWGVLIGTSAVIVGYLAASAADGGVSASDGPTFSFAVALAAIPVVLTSALVGGAIGAGMDHWEQVYPVE